MITYQLTICLLHLVWQVNKFIIFHLCIEYIVYVQKINLKYQIIVLFLPHNCFVNFP